MVENLGLVRGGGGYQLPLKTPDWLTIPQRGRSAIGNSSWRIAFPVRMATRVN